MGGADAFQLSILPIMATAGCHSGDRNSTTSSPPAGPITPDQARAIAEAVPADRRPASDLRRADGHNHVCQADRAQAGCLPRRPNPPGDRRHQRRVRRGLRGPRCGLPWPGSERLGCSRNMAERTAGEIRGRLPGISVAAEIRSCAQAASGVSGITGGPPGQPSKGPEGRFSSMK